MSEAIKKGRKPKPKDYKFGNPFVTNLQNLLTNNKVTQDALANNIGVTRQALSKWVTGDTIPDILSASKIADYFNVSTDYLLGRTEHRTTDKELSEVCDYLGLSEASINFIKDFPDKYVLNFIFENEHGKALLLQFCNLKREKVDKYVYDKRTKEFSAIYKFFRENYDMRIRSNISIANISIDETIQSALSSIHIDEFARRVLDIQIDCSGLLKDVIINFINSEDARYNSTPSTEPVVKPTIIAEWDE